MPWVPALGADGSARHIVISYAVAWAEAPMHEYYTRDKYTGPAKAANCVCFKNGERCTNNANTMPFGTALAYGPCNLCKSFHDAAGLTVWLLLFPMLGPLPLLPSQLRITPTEVDDSQRCFGVTRERGVAMGRCWSRGTRVGGRFLCKACVKEAAAQRLLLDQQAAEHLRAGGASQELSHVHPLVFLPLSDAPQR